MERFSRLTTTVVLFILLISGQSFSQDVKKLTLDDCIEIALKNNTNIVSAKSYFRMAKSGLKASRGNFMPQINLYTSWTTREKEMYAIRFDELVSSRESYYYQISFNQPIFTGLRNIAMLKQNKAENNRYMNNLKWTQQTVVLDVKLKYYNVLKKEQLLKVAQEAFEMSKKELERVESMEKLGAASRAEVYQQKVRVGENQLALIKARNDYIISKTDLNYTLGIDVTTELRLDPVLPSTDFEKKEIDFQQAIAEALRNRLDYRAMEDKLRSTRAKVTVQKSNYYPTVSLTGNYNWWDVQFPQRARDINEFDTYSVSVNVSMNLFNGFRTKASVSSAQAEVVAAQADLEQAKRQVILDVKKAMLELERTLENIEVTRENVVAAEEEYRLASERYRIGAGTMLEQLAAQNSLTKAKVNRIQAIYDYRYALTVFELAIGKLSW